jgi:hypothetical protein
MIRKIRVFALLIVIDSMLIPQPVSAAYIDPNTGGMLFQLLAVIFGVLSGIILIFSSRIKMLYFRIRRKVAGTKNEPTSSEAEPKSKLPE